MAVGFTVSSVLDFLSSFLAVVSVGSGLALSDPSSPLSVASVLGSEVFPVDEVLAKATDSFAEVLGTSLNSLGAFLVDPANAFGEFLSTETNLISSDSKFFCTIFWPVTKPIKKAKKTTIKTRIISRIILSLSDMQ